MAKQEQVVEMWNSGIDKKEIAEKLELKINTVSKYLYQARKSGQEIRKIGKQEQVIEMWNSGIDKKEIAEKLGLRIKTVTVYLYQAKKTGQEVRKQERKTGKQEQVIEMWNSGINKKEIAKKLGLKIDTVTVYLYQARKAGQELRKNSVKRGRKTGKKEQVIEMWNSGIDKKEIAEKLELRIKTVTVYLYQAKKTGQEIRKQERKTGKKNKVVEMWNSGIDKKEIAEKLGITTKSVDGRLYRARKTGQEVRKTGKQDQVVEMWNSGIDKKEIAEKLGITTKSVDVHLYRARKAGQEVRKNPVKRTRKAEKQEQVVEMWNSGIDKKEIAEKLGITTRSVDGRLYRARKTGQEVRKQEGKTGKKEQVVEMWNSGINKKEIAEKLGLRIDTVIVYLCQARKSGQELRKNPVNRARKPRQTLTKVSKEKKTEQEKSSLNTPKIEKARGQGIDIKSKIMAMLCTNLPIDVAEKLKIKPFVVYDIVDSLSEDEKKEILKKFVRSKKEVFSYVRNKKEKGISTLTALKTLNTEKGNKLYRELSEIYLIMGLQNQAEGVLNSIIANDSGANVYIRDQVTMQLHKIKTEILTQNIRTDYYRKRNMDNTRISYEDLCKKYNVRFSFLLQILGMERDYTDKQNSDR